MEIEEVKKWIGKKVKIILKTGTIISGIIPQFEGSSFSITDMFEEENSIDCNMIGFIKEIKK